MNAIKNEDLNKLNIFNLRELARDTGVASPTSKLKEQLITEIIEIREGRRERHVAKTKQGRPPKSSKFEFVKLFTNNIPSTSAVLRQERPNYIHADSSILSGFLEVFENGTARMIVEGYTDNYYYLDSDLLRNYSLKTGDKIVAELATKNDQTYVKDIYNINGDPVTEIVETRLNYYDFSHEIVPTPIDVKGCELNISRGDNVYFYGGNNLNNSQMLISILNGMTNVKKIYLNISLTEKNKAIVRTIKDAEMFVANLTDSLDIGKRVLMLATEHAKRMFERGENVVIVVDDLLSVSAVEDADLGSTKELISLAKNTKDNGSITILAIMSKHDRLAWAERLADQKYNISASNITQIL